MHPALIVADLEYCGQFAESFQGSLHLHVATPLCVRSEKSALQSGTSLQEKDDTTFPEDLKLSDGNKDRYALPFRRDKIDTNSGLQLPCDLLNSIKIKELRVIDHIRVNKFVVSDGFS